jgi:hypothetical protein
MQEEFTPACTPACITIDGTLLEFPREDPVVRPTSPMPQIVSTTIPHSNTIVLPKTFILSSPPPPLSQDSPTLPQSLYHQHGSPSLSISSSRSSTSTRLSNWLAHSHVRGPSSSTSISTNTTRSFAEHRRKRSEFYSVKVPAVPVMGMTPTTTPPTSTRVPFQQNFKLRGRQRTMSSSSVGSNSTVNTDIMSLEDGQAGSVITISTGRVGGRREKKEVEVDMPFILQGPGILEKEVGIAI